MLTLGFMYPARFAV